MRKRSIKMSFYVNEKEKKLIEKNAKKCGLSIRSYLMFLVQGYKPVEQPNENIIEMLLQLRKIGTNLNQIARVANAYDYINKDFLNREILKVNEFIDAFIYKYLDVNK